MTTQARALTISQTTTSQIGSLTTGVRTLSGATGMVSPRMMLISGI